jgi:hypothetical protein
LEALISLLSQHRLFETWIDIHIDRKLASYEITNVFEKLHDLRLEIEGKAFMKLADTIRLVAVEHLQILVTKKSGALLRRFKDLNGFKLLLDILTLSESANVKYEILRLLNIVIGQYAATLVQIRAIDCLATLSKTTSGQEIRDLAEKILGILLATLEKLLERELKNITSSTRSIDSKMDSLATLVPIVAQPETILCVLQHWEAGTIPTVFKQILSLKNDAVNRYLYLITLLVLILQFYL